MTNLTLKARQRFSLDRYATEVTGIRIVAAEQLYARCELTLTPQHRNAMGAVMGGVMFTLADLAFAIAANSRCLADDTPLEWVSLNSCIHYLSQPIGDSLIAETTSIKQGNSTCVFSISIHDETNKPIALITTTGMHIN